MRLSQAEFDHAYQVLKEINEPVYQKGCAVVITTMAMEAAKKHIDFPRARVLITHKVLEELRYVANEKIKKYLSETNYNKPLVNQQFLKDVAVIFEAEGSEIKLIPSHHLLLLSQGIAPVSFFQHDRAVIENMWVAHKEKHPTA